MVDSYKPASAINVSTSAGRAKLWHERIARARKMLHIDDRKRIRDEAMTYINGEYHGSSDKVYLNEALPAMEDVINGTIPTIPSVDVEARQPDQQLLSDKCSALIDATMESGLVRCYQTAVAVEWDEAGYGIGIASMGWQEEVTPREAQSSSDLDYAAPHMARAAEENASPDTAMISEADDHSLHLIAHEEELAALDAAMPGMADTTALKAHTDQHWARVGVARTAHPVARRVDPMRFLYCPDSEQWEERRWEAEECDEYINALRLLPGIKNLNRENCPAIDDTGTNDQERESEAYDKENQQVKVWKIHDRVNRKYVIIPFDEAEGQQPLLEEDWPFGGMELYGAIIHRPKPDSIHGHATLHLIEPILDELARTNAVIRRHNRRASKYKVLLANTVHKKDQARMMSDNPVEGVDPAALATSKEFKPPPLPKEITEYRQTLLNELRRVMGTDIMQQGGDTSHQISATEAGLRGGYHDSRLSRRRKQMSSLLGWMARNVILMYRAFIPEGESIPVMIAGPMGTVVDELDPATIPEDLMVKLDMSMVTEEGRQQQAQNAQTFVEYLAKLGPGLYDPIEALTYLGEVMKVPNPRRFFTAQGQPGGMGMEGGMASQPNLSEPGGQAGLAPQADLKLAN